MQNNQHRVVCYGEILWDILPTGAVPGGAPMNVAYHLHKLKKHPALITRIGNDERGKELVNIFSQHGVCTDFFQTDTEYETGKVHATPNERHEMLYEIIRPVAWDFISWDDELDELVRQSDYFVFGTLACRNEVSKDTLLRLMDAANKKVLDINLRAPHYDRTIVEQLMKKADLVKMNNDELDLISHWYFGEAEMEDKIQMLCDRFSVPNMVVTMGGDGAMLYMDGNMHRHAGIRVQVADTVGAGDAFLAGLLSQLMDGAGHEEALAFASALGALIASKKGGCPDYDVAEVHALMKANNIQA